MVSLMLAKNLPTTQSSINFIVKQKYAQYVLQTLESSDWANQTPPPTHKAPCASHFFFDIYEATIKRSTIFPQKNCLPNSANAQYKIYFCDATI